MTQDNISQIKAKLDEIESTPSRCRPQSIILTQSLRLAVDGLLQARDDFDQADMTFQRDNIDDEISAISKILTGSEGE